MCEGGKWRTFENAEDLVEIAVGQLVNDDVALENLLEEVEFSVLDWQRSGYRISLDRLVQLVIAVRIERA